MIKTPLLNQDSSATATVFEFGDDRDSVESDDGKRSFLKSASDEFDCRQFRTKEFKLDNQSERITVEKHKWEALEIQNRVLKSDLLQSTWHAKQLETKLASFEAKSLNESRWSSSMVNHFERLVLKSKDKQQTLKPTTINTKVDGTSQELNNIVIKLQNALSQSLQRVEELEQVVELQHAKLTNSHNRPEGDLGYNLCKSGIENNMARINEIIEPLATKSQIINELQQINIRVQEIIALKSVQDRSLLEQTKLNIELKQLIVGMNLSAKRKETTDQLLIKYNDLRNEYSALVARHT